VPAFSRTVFDVVGAHLAFTSIRRSYFPLNPVERGEHLVDCAAVMSDTNCPRPVGTRNRVPDLGGEAIVREVGDRLELAEIVRAAVVCTMKGSPSCEDLRSLHRVPPGHAPS